MAELRWVSGLLISIMASGCGDDGAGGAGATSSGGSGGAGATGAGASGGSGGAGGDGIDPRFLPLVEALEEDLAASDAYGVSVAVLEGSEVTFAHAIGSKDPDGEEPLLPTTLMQIGSTTKQLTAAALLRKVEAGEVSLDDSLEDVVPGIEFALDPTWDDQITMHHLLSHQSGLYDLADWTNNPEDEYLASFTAVLDDDIFVMNRPGAFWNYSNTGFSLAGLAAQELDTRAYADILREDLFVPLGMSRTVLRKSEAEADGDFSLSYGFTAADVQSGGAPGDVKMSAVIDSAFSRPAGFAWSTPTEMLQWARFLMEGDETILSDELRAALTDEQVNTLYYGDLTHYGYGMFVWRGYLTKEGTLYPTRVWEHGGNTLTFTNIMVMLPEHDFAVVITSSAYGTDFTHSADVAVETLVADLPAGEDPPPDVIDPSTFGRHVGSYDDAFNVGQVEITQEGDELHISMPDLDALGYDVDPVLVPITSEIFVLTVDGQPLDVTFIPDGDESTSSWVRNRAFVFTRVAAMPPLPAPSPSAPALTATDRRVRIDALLSRARLHVD